MDGLCVCGKRGRCEAARRIKRQLAAIGSAIGSALGSACAGKGPQERTKRQVHAPLRGVRVRRKGASPPTFTFLRAASTYPKGPRGVRLAKWMVTGNCRAGT